MIFTPRILKELWQILHSSGEISRNPDAPSWEAFLQHYAVANAAQGFSWSDRREGTTYQRGVGLTYLYDLTINQLQVTPAVYPLAEEVDKVNVRLWACLPPRFLEEPTDWKKHWQEAVRAVDVSAMRFIVEQGYEFMTPFEWTRLWEKAVHDFDVTTLRFLVERDFDATVVMQRADWKRMWFEAALDWKVEVMAFMLEQGFDVNTLDDHGKSALYSALANHGGRHEPVELLVKAGIELGDVERLIQYCAEGVDDKAGAGEAAEIARYLRREAKERAEAASKAFSKS